MEEHTPELVKMSKRDFSVNKPKTRTIALIITLVLSSLIAFAFMVLPEYMGNRGIQINVGEVASEDILAPFSINYESAILTYRAKQNAANAVEDIYIPSDPSIARNQLNKLEAALNYITSVKNDPIASQEQKIEDLMGMKNLHLKTEDYNKILAMESNDWQAVGLEAARVLENVLRESLRENQVDRARTNLPNIVKFSFKLEQTQITTAIVSDLIVPTSPFSPVETQKARDLASANVQPVIRQIVAGEAIVRRGEVLGEVDMEALNMFGLTKPADQSNMFIKNAVIILVCAILVLVFYKNRSTKEMQQPLAMILVAFFFLLFLGLSRFLVMGNTVWPYLFPLAAFGLTISIIFNFEFGALLTFILSFLTVFGFGREAELIIFYLVPGLVAMLLLGDARRLGTFFAAGFISSAFAAAIVVIFRLGDSYTDWLGLGTLLAASLFNGLATATLALLLQHIFASILDLPTSLQLMDISRPDHPLLQMLLNNAPGTYQHSLQVSNLAEQAADAIGANRLLVRAGTLFHDIGKAANASFFIENQIRDNVNSHDESDPYETSATIINHVIDGVALAKKHRLPSRIVDFILEHHGNNITRYQFAKAVDLAGGDESNVDPDKFRYPGPSPQSRETALLMLADGTEARTRANNPQTDEEILDIIDAVIKTVIDSRQLDDTNLTLKDLNTIKQSFFETIKRSYHPRIKYPEQKALKEEAPDTEDLEETPESQPMQIISSDEPELLENQQTPEKTLSETQEVVSFEAPKPKSKKKKQGR